MSINTKCVRCGRLIATTDIDEVLKLVKANPGRNICVACESIEFEPCPSCGSKTGGCHFGCERSHKRFMESIK